MTEEQRSLAEENHGLVWAFLKKYGYDPEEFYGDAAIGLCYAAIYYRPERGTFSTYAYRCMQAQCLRTVEENKRFAMVSAVPLDGEISDDSSKRYEEIISAGEDHIRTADRMSDYMRLIGSFSLAEMRVVLMLLQGKTQVEAAQVLGCSKANITYILQKIRRAYLGVGRVKSLDMGDEAMRHTMAQKISETLCNT